MAPIPENQIEAGKFYRHFKGGLYQVLYIALDVTGDNNKPVVVYKKADEASIYVRDYEEFSSPVDKHKYPDVKQYYRFEKC